MFVRKTLAALASLAMAGAGMLALASPALSVEQTATIACTVGGNTDTTLDGTGPWIFVLGDCGSYAEVSVANTAESLKGTSSNPKLEAYDGPTYSRSITGSVNGYSGPNPYIEINQRVKVSYPTDVEPTSGTIQVDFRSQYNDKPSQTFLITLGEGGDDGGDDGGGDVGGDQSSGSSGSAGSNSSSPSISLQVLDEADGSWARALEAGLVAWEKTVSVNTWQPLPNSADVVGTGQDEGKVFLGVATTPDFPVDIAQRQVDNGWGAYDMHDDQGNLESVFIPAGGSMFVWTQPRLYAVWGDPAS